MRSSITTYILFFLLLFFFIPREGICYKPKTHLYLALKAIRPILQGTNKMEIGGIRYEIDSEAALVIRDYPGYYLGGVIGPDGFPDIMFGQMIIHPDTRCHTQNGEWVCDSTAENGSWTWEWFAYLYKAAKDLQGEERKKALAFVLGYMTHGAGDMWGHTFINYFAGGAWPENLAADRNRAIRHTIVENIIGNYTPDIRAEIDSLGGIKAPVEFIIKQFFNDPWSQKRSAKSFSGLFMKLRTDLQEKRSKKIYWPLRSYLDCWIEEIDKGLQDWPLVSIRVAEELFVNDEIDSALASVYAFRDEHLYKMLSADPISLIASCNNHPEINIAKSMTAITKFVARIPGIKKLQQMVGSLENFLFVKVFGISIDSLKNYMKNPVEYLDPSRGFFAAGDREKIFELISIDSTTGSFSDDKFAIAYNTIQSCKLILFNPEQLDKILFDFNTGPLYTSPNLSPSKKENIMMGFIRSLDGNHQWRIMPPDLPSQEPPRQFSDEMPLWTDCLARNNFFGKIFHDWTISGVSIPFSEPGACSHITNLPPVTARYEILNAENKEDTFYYSGCGEPEVVRVTLVNHQAKAQDYSLYITYEISQDLIVPPFTHATEMIPGFSCFQPVSGLDSAQAQKYYRDSCLMPNTPSNVFAQTIRNGYLPGTTGMTDKPVFIIPLPVCLNGKFTMHIYLLEKLNSPELPILDPARNSLIKINEAEGLTLPVNASYTANLAISCGDCPCRYVHPCSVVPEKNNLK